MSKDLNLSLIVIRVADIERAVAFYAALGLHFTKEQHGKGPVHYCALIEETVFELYPASEKFPVTSLRLGFVVDSIAAVLARWQQVDNEASGKTSAISGKYPEGDRITVTDPDGHRIELTQR